MRHSLDHHETTNSLPLTVEDGVVVLIPAHNEELSLRDVIREIRMEFIGEIVVIDDASTDATASLARSEGATVLSLVNSLGAWGAIQTGLRYAVRRQYRCAITMDADGQHVPSFMHELARPVLNGDTDVVIGAFSNRGSSPRRFAWFVFRRFSGLTLRDLTSGLRAYNAKAMALLVSPSASLIDFQDMGVLIALHYAGLRMEERPVIMRPRQAGQSRIFGSWWRIMGYMAQTTIICLTKRRWLPYLQKRGRVVS